MNAFAVILAAAGKSSRFASPDQKKVFTNVDSQPMWMHAAHAFAKRADVAQLILVIAAEDQDMFQQQQAAMAARLGVQVVLGGAQRADSVLKGLAAVRADIPFVAIHDAARPCVLDSSIDRVFAAAEASDAAILAIPCSSTLKRADARGCIVETVPRDQLWLAQTPQVFRRTVLEGAYAEHSNPSLATDDASILEATGYPVTIVEDSPQNIKVTTQADLLFVEFTLQSRTS
ncbi:2-C-methyl-D-erythritol 4-phosphate cytidylyltransferase [Aureliella helgolandensis]|uniref:2-C-methyl-D-erythritol 4-phosphate cytidylyltransferase n=1 Tax=Aureliella helgolandensis TaxID=2527968 RepID=A0A518G5L8_9BACT|nr:2-C-methyl-D-erythritol 4-phosphate cytidylyltransferase [Aureliella helgolandensis]QDV23878.1 2-C-methyl-D-erythritol 4-phosphate cytidylyltransferase [Aureliella helgolandensis]